MEDIRNFMNEKLKENSEVNEKRIEQTGMFELIDWVWKWQKEAGRDFVISNLELVTKLYKDDKLPNTDN